MFVTFEVLNDVTSIVVRPLAPENILAIVVAFEVLKLVNEIDVKEALFANK